MNVPLVVLEVVVAAAAEEEEAEARAGAVVLPDPLWSDSIAQISLHTVASMRAPALLRLQLLELVHDRTPPRHRLFATMAVTLVTTPVAVALVANPAAVVPAAIAVVAALPRHKVVGPAVPAVNPVVVALALTLVVIVLVATPVAMVQAIAEVAAVVPTRKLVVAVVAVVTLVVVVVM